MATINYFSLDGELIAEETIGGPGIRSFGLNSLGSVTSTFSSSGTLENTYLYSPFGIQTSRTGGSTDPAFTWVGGEGYRSTGRQYSETYVRSRHYSHQFAGWTAADRLFTRTNRKYVYCINNPVTLVDPLGLSPCLHFDPTNCKWKPDAVKVCDAIVCCNKNASCRKKMELAWTLEGESPAAAKREVDCMVKHCDGTYCINVTCHNCTKCDRGHSRACAWTKQGTFATSCSIYICMEHMGLMTAAWWCPFNLKWIHEITHCCGSNDVSTGAPPPDADGIAIAIELYLGKFHCL